MAIKQVLLPPPLKKNLEDKIKKFEKNFTIVSGKALNAELHGKNVLIYPDIDDVIWEIVGVNNTSKGKFIRDTHRYRVIEIEGTRYQVNYWQAESDYQKRYMKAFKQED